MNELNALLGCYCSFHLCTVHCIFPISSLITEFEFCRIMKAKPSIAGAKRFKGKKKVKNLAEKQQKKLHLNKADRQKVLLVSMLMFR